MTQNIIMVVCLVCAFWYGVPMVADIVKNLLKEI